MDDWKFWPVPRDVHPLQIHGANSPSSYPPLFPFPSLSFLPSLYPFPFSSISCFFSSCFLSPSLFPPLPFSPNPVKEFGERLEFPRIEFGAF